MKSKTNISHNMDKGNDGIPSFNFNVRFKYYTYFQIYCVLEYLYLIKDFGLSIFMNRCAWFTISSNVCKQCDKQVINFLLISELNHL